MAFEQYLSIERVLVCLDGSAFGQAGVRYAAAIARSTGAELLLLHVLDRAASGSLRPVDALDAEMDRVERVAYLEDVVKRLRDRGLRVRSLVGEGRAAEQILHVAEQEHADIVVLASHGRRQVTRFLLGGTSQKITQHAVQSLIVVRPGSEDVDGLCLDCSIRRVLVLFDGSQNAESSLAAALQIARSENAEVVIGHAAIHPSLSVSTPPTRRDRDLLQELRQRNMELAHDYLRRVQGKLETAGVSCRYIVAVAEDVRHALVQLVQREQPDLVLIASHGQTSSRHSTHGNLTQHLLTYADRPIWVVQNMQSTHNAHRERGTFEPRVEHHGLRVVSERLDQRS